MDDEYVDLNDYNIAWGTIPEQIKSALFSYDVGRICLAVLKEYPDMDINEAANISNVLLRVFLNSRDNSNEVH